MTAAGKNSRSSELSTGSPQPTSTGNCLTTGTPSRSNITAGLVALHNAPARCQSFEIGSGLFHRTALASVIDSRNIILPLRRAPPAKQPCPTRPSPTPCRVRERPRQLQPSHLLMINQTRHPGAHRQARAWPWLNASGSCRAVRLFALQGLWPRSAPGVLHLHS